MLQTNSSYQILASAKTRISSLASSEIHLLSLRKYSTSGNVERKPRRTRDAELLAYKQYYQKLKLLTQNEIPNDVVANSPPLITLHKRLNLPQEFSMSMLSRCLTCQSSELPNTTQPSTILAKRETLFSKDFCDNKGLNIFGKNILSYHVTNSILKKYPRLPTIVLNAAIAAYLSEHVLASIGKNWGIESERRTVMERFLINEPYDITLGKLRFYNNAMGKNDGIELISLKKQFNETKAMALAVRSIIGSLWAVTHTTKPEMTFKFIDDHIISRKLDVSKMFMFEQPTRELAKLCEREGLERPISKLMAESGRLSKAPVFIVGAFSGKEKLGEGYGSSLKEAKARAATDALLKWYCYQPTEGQSPVVDQ